MRQRTEIFVTIILLATVLRQGKKKRKKDCIKRAAFYRLHDVWYANKLLLLLLQKKKFKMFIVYKYCKNNKTVSEFQMHNYENAHTCTWYITLKAFFLCSINFYWKHVFQRSRNLIFFFCSMHLFLSLIFL